MYISSMMVCKIESSSNGPRSFPGGGEHVFALQFWFFKPSVKNQWGKGRMPNFVILIVWTSLIVVGWVVVARSGKSCLGKAKIVSFVFFTLFKDGERRVSPKFHLFVSVLIKGTRKLMNLNSQLIDLNS